MCVYEDSHMDFVLYSTNMVYYINWLLDVKPLYILGHLVCYGV